MNLKLVENGAKTTKNYQIWSDISLWQFQGLSQRYLSSYFTPIYQNTNVRPVISCGKAWNDREYHYFYFIFVSFGFICTEDLKSSQKLIMNAKDLNAKIHFQFFHEKTAQKAQINALLLPLNTRLMENQN